MTAGAPAGGSDGLARRLRETRVAQGLSQSELAGGDLSASYISLLEAGKRTPTPDVVALLAERLTCTPDYLLRGVDPAESDRARLTLEYAELALRNGESADALAQLDRLLMESSMLGAEATWRARRLHAQALESVGRISDALTELEVLRSEAAAGKRYADELQLTVDLVRCYEEVGDVSLAVDVGQATLVRMTDLDLAGTDEHAQLVSSLIGAHYERGDLRRAQILATEALAQVEVRGSPSARAKVYWNASLAADGSGDTAGALMLAERAVALLSEGHETRSIGRLRTALGWLYLRIDPPDLDRAHEELEAAGETLRDSGSRIDRAYVETELGRCEVMRGNPAQALAHTAAATEYLGDEVLTQSAHVRLVEGRALLALGRRTEAVECYRAATSLMEVLGVSRQGADAWRELGDAYADLGMAAEAAQAYRVALTAVGVRPAPTAVVSTPAAGMITGG